MLKALELLGFKSFADKTRFEFPAGITVVVGPNGSGKSNVVDAVRWVLGEQSAKSLRGREMADVIFNGSATRRPLNAAEVTLTFDNRQRMLPLDTPEVHITRRVYRGGEGEYLINRQASRLRDVRELFAGTGAATEAYSIIEQGKVDILLQASPRERRIIFEEAAGISRFKAKKLETQRRLERVEQNLLRLKDIVDEVEGRLRSVRLQAGKARRYKEYADRLQALRVQVARVDGRELAARLAEVGEQIAELRGQIVAARGESTDAEAEVARLDEQIRTLTDTWRARETQRSEVRQRIARLEATLEVERRRGLELEEEARPLRAQWRDLGAEAATVAVRVEQSNQAVSEAEAQQRAMAEEVAAREAEQGGLAEQSSAASSKLERLRHELVAAMRQAAQGQAELKQAAAEDESESVRSQQLARRLAELDAQQSTRAEQHQAAQAEHASAQTEVARLGAQWNEARELSEQLRQQAQNVDRELARLRQRHAAASERASLLEELHRRLEGVEAGVKSLMLRVAESSRGPAARVLGLLADLLEVRWEHAPLIELALGDSAHAVVCPRAAELVAWIEQQPEPLGGRIEILALDWPRPAVAADVDLSTARGVVARADSLVTASAELQPLLGRLLGHCWIVETLDDALRLAAQAPRDYRFVARSGHLVTGDGRVLCGTRQATGGLLARQSELRALAEQIADWSTRIESTEALSARVATALSEQELLVARLTLESREAGERAAELRSQLAGSEAALRALDGERTEIASSLEAARQQATQRAERIQAARVSTAEAEAQYTQLQAELSSLASEHEQLDRQAAAAMERTTEVKIRWARGEQRLDALRAQLAQLSGDASSRQRAAEQAQRRLEHSFTRRQAIERGLLETEQQLAGLYLDEEALGRTAAELAAETRAAEQRRLVAAQAAQAARTVAEELDRRAHRLELSAHELRHQRQSLIERLREDYDLDLEQLEAAAAAEPPEDRTEVDREIAELRRKLQQLGNVNLDALDELGVLEERGARMSADFDDLTRAKAALEAIIQRINTDSRRLFHDTLETVRGHFQELFRKLFGGGQADIVMEEGQDPLDAGVDLVARPPGKELRSISLLSGGEKTLTCVALLLAVFRSRPSPFCVLDEVDAALDEANIERFIGVLQEFLAWTQFIVVTHSKKTMTCAQTLYGVTMQESGISKRVAVQFDDVSDDGHIRETALTDDSQAA